MTVFKFLEDKDVFLTLYTNKLAKRLIHNMSVSDEAESTAVLRLRDACGYEYTSKLSRMLTGVFLYLINFI
jgi:cullin 1